MFNPFLRVPYSFEKFSSILVIHLLNLSLERLELREGQKEELLLQTKTMVDPFFETKISLKYKPTLSTLYQ